MPDDNKILEIVKEDTSNNSTYKLKKTKFRAHYTIALMTAFALILGTIAYFAITGIGAIIGMSFLGLFIGLVVDFALNASKKSINVENKLLSLKNFTQKNNEKDELELNENIKIGKIQELSQNKENKIIEIKSLNNISKNQDSLLF